MKKTRMIASVSAAGLAVGAAMFVPPMTAAEDGTSSVEALNPGDAASQGLSQPAAEQSAAQPVMDGVHLVVEDGKILLNPENIGQDPTVFFPDDARAGATFTVGLPKDKDGTLYVPTELVDVHNPLTVSSLDNTRHVGELKLLDKDSSQSVTEGDDIEFTLQDDSPKIGRWIAGVLPAVPLTDVPAVEAENAAQDAAAQESPAPEAPQESPAPEAPQESPAPEAPQESPAPEAAEVPQDTSTALPLAEDAAEVAVEREGAPSEGSASLTELLKHNGGELNITARKCNPDGSKATLVNGVMGAKDAQTKSDDPLLELSITGKRACLPDTEADTTTSSSQEATSDTEAPETSEVTATSEPSVQATSSEPTSTVASETTVPGDTGSTSTATVTSSQVSLTLQADKAQVVPAATSTQSSTKAHSSAKSTPKSTTAKATTKTSTKVTSTTSAKPRPANSTRVVIASIPSGPTTAAGSVPLYVK